MKIIDVEQGSDEWFEARMGIPTASEFHNLVTPLWKPRTGETPETYLNKKLAERWAGEPLASRGGGSMEQGSIREGEAVPWYSLKFKVDVRKVGFITTDDGRIGCSPDGLITDALGLECKCPERHTHVGYLRNGKLPKEYAAQVQGSMLVTGAPEWVFLSYCPGFDALILRVPRDPVACEALAEALAEFNANLDAGYARLCEIHGGPPGPPDPEVVEHDYDAEFAAMFPVGEPVPQPTPERAAEMLRESTRILDEKGL